MRWRFAHYFGQEVPVGHNEGEHNLLGTQPISQCRIGLFRLKEWDTFRTGKLRDRVLLKLFTSPLSTVGLRDHPCKRAEIASLLMEIL
jgi:hypothetical protein